MLTGDLVRPRLKQRGDQLLVDTLPVEDSGWRRTAAELIDLWAKQAGRSREDWESAVEHYLGDRVDYIAVRGLAKVLADDGRFEQPKTAIDPEALRELLFASGPTFEQGDLFHPQTRAERIAAAAVELNIAPASVEAALYADRPGAQVVTDKGRDWTPEALLTRYNLELHRGVLYWSNFMEVQIYDTFKDFWRYLKLFKLMFEAQPIEGGYRVALDGPISPFVRSTTRYGRQLAAFLPALLLCQQWQMRATVRLSAFEHELIYPARPPCGPDLALCPQWRFRQPSSRRNWAMNGASGV